MIELTPIKLGLNEFKDFEFTAGTDTEEEYKFEMLTDEAVLIVEAGGDDDVVVTVRGGDYYQKDNQEYVPLETTVSAGESTIVGPVESAKFKTENGEVEFEIDIDGTDDDESDVNMAVIQMPLMGVERN